MWYRKKDIHTVAEGLTHSMTKCKKIKKKFYTRLYVLCTQNASMLYYIWLYGDFVGSMKLNARDRKRIKYPAVITAPPSTPDCKYTATKYTELKKYKITIWDIKIIIQHVYINTGHVKNIIIFHFFLLWIYWCNILDT